MKINLGFEDRPYAQKHITPTRRKFQTGKYGKGTSSAQVAEMLEEFYGILESFVEEESTISDVLEDEFADRIDSVMAGVPYDKSNMDKRLKGVEEAFKTMLNMEMLHTRGRVPTAAAQRENRKSFIRTGLYRSSFRAWVEEDE